MIIIKLFIDITVYNYAIISLAKEYDFRYRKYLITNIFLMFYKNVKNRIVIQ